MGRLFSLPDKEEVRGSNPRAPTGDLQGFLPLDTPLGPPSATILQPKCLVMVGTERDAVSVIGMKAALRSAFGWSRPASLRTPAVSYTHLRAHETDSYL